MRSLSLLVRSCCVLVGLWSTARANDDYFADNIDDGANQYYNNKNNNYNKNYNKNNYNNNQYQQNQYNYNKNNNGGDDAYQAVADDAVAAYNGNQNDDQANNQQADQNYDDYFKHNNDDAYKNEQENYYAKDDDTFHWNANVGFDGVSFMPVSCVNYNNGHMIKFQLFDTAQSYQCHFAEISTFVVSIAHYMRAYFNYQALQDGKDFVLPEDAAFLNCQKIGDLNNGMNLYGKIGCMERETFTSTKLQLHLYTDAQCSNLFDDGESSKKHARKGYNIGDDMVISTQVSFRVPFYSCLTCTPDEVSGTFNKRNGNWYDDDYISTYGMKQGSYGNQVDDQNQADDKYMSSNDDVGNYADDKYNNRKLLTAVDLAPQEYAEDFWRAYDVMKYGRQLYDNYYDIGQWNMCQRIYKYGVWCDEECRELDFFRTDQWSGSDIFLLSIMCTFLSGLMLLIVAKRLKAQQKARLYGDDQPLPGLPPFGMAIIFSVTMAVVITLAKLRFVNETLIFAVVTCIILFIYMLKLTLFENRRPVLLAAPRHEMFSQNPLGDHLFD